VSRDVLMVLDGRVFAGAAVNSRSRRASLVPSATEDSSSAPTECATVSPSIRLRKRRVAGVSCP